MTGSENRSNPKVQVRTARSDERVLIEGMAQFYIYDFSEMEPPESQNIVFKKDGTFGQIPEFEEHWSDEPGRRVLLIETYGAPVGFALLNSRSHLTGGRVEHNMGEFFVARKYRRQGVATQALHQVLDLYPGRWEVAIVERNFAAQIFWPRAIASASGVSDLVRCEGQGMLWRGPIWTFLASSAL
jgi:predicted acetyltransferase